MPNDTVYDADGIAIPAMWRANPERWARLPLSTRQRSAAGHARREEEAAKPKVYRPGATRFTTDAAVKWGRKQGWKLVDRENYDARTRHHGDLQLGVDALFDDGNGLIGVQGAGRSERKEHRERFEQRGGEEVARRRHIRIVYVEFVRGNPEPIVKEWWVE